MTRGARPLLWATALVIAVVLAVWRARPPPAVQRGEARSPAAASSGMSPFSPPPSAASAITNPNGPTPQLPAAATPPAEAPDAAAPSAPEVDVERRQDAKIARGLTDGQSGGVLVLATPPGSVAGALHLRPGDLITAINGRALTSTEEFVQLYRAEGLPNQLTVLREGREIHVH